MFKAAISWSGGKDSCAAYHRTRADFHFVCALTMFNGDGTRSRSHGLRPEILDAQVKRLGLQPLSQRCEWATYDEAFDRGLADAARLGVTHVIFGDILFDEHKQWAERLTSGHGMTAVEPLWKQSTTDLYRDFLALDAKARIVTIRARASLMSRFWDATLRKIFCRSLSRGASTRAASVASTTRW